MRDRRYFLAITRNQETKCYDIYFVNASDHTISALIMGSSGVATADDDVLMTSSYERKFQDIAPSSYVHVDTLDDYDLDFSTQYDFTLNTEVKEEHLRFHIGKRIGFLGNKIPILNKMGRRIYP